MAGAQAAEQAGSREQMDTGGEGGIPLAPCSDGVCSSPWSHEGSQAPVGAFSSLCKVVPWLGKEMDSRAGSVAQDTAYHCSQKLTQIRQVLEHLNTLPLGSWDVSTNRARCQGLLLIASISQTQPLLETKEKAAVVTACLASTLSLPSAENLVEADAAGAQRAQAELMEALGRLLSGLLLEKANPAELQGLLDHVGPWMASQKVHERARAVSTALGLLKSAASSPQFHARPEFPRPGLLAERLLACVGAPGAAVSREALQGLQLLRSLVQRQAAPGTKILWGNAEQEQEENLDLLESPETNAKFLEIIKELEQLLTPDQLTDLILTVTGSLKEASESSIEASKAALTLILNKYKRGLQAKVPALVFGFYQHLGSLQRSRARHAVLTWLFLLAHAFMEEATVALLSFQLPLDKDAAGMWRALVKARVVPDTQRLMNILLRRLRERPGTDGERESTAPIAAASAVREVLSVHKGPSAVTARLFPRLLVALLVQARYGAGLAVPRSRAGLPAAGCAVEAVKTLLLKMGCHHELAWVEKEGGWDMLITPQNHHRGVSLLARAMVHYNCCELCRILYHLVPFLEQGDKQLKITAMAFFVELLHLPEAKRLPQKYSVTRLAEGLADCDAVMRVLCVRGLITMEKWHRKDIQGLVPAMMSSLQGVDGKLVLEALADVGNVLRGLDTAGGASCITGRLRLLFDDERASVRLAAVSLFGAALRSLGRRRQRLVGSEELLDSFLPLLLRAQEGNADVAKKCARAVQECAWLLRWKLPKEVGHEQTWNSHPENVRKICKELVRKHGENARRFLSQSQRYLQSPQPSLRRAAALFVGFLLAHMDPLGATETTAPGKGPVAAV